jgi:hypothetical protein
MLLKLRFGATAVGLGWYREVGLFAETADDVASWARQVTSFAASSPRRFRKSSSSRCQLRRGLRRGRCLSPALVGVR